MLAWAVLGMDGHSGHRPVAATAVLVGNHKLCLLGHGLEDFDGVGDTHNLYAFLR